jgi:hypothetical protein
MIFVFGSNESGIHGGGAAHFAYKKKGARWGFSYGHMGDSFAIPTKGFIMKHEFGETSRAYVGDTLSHMQILGYVQGFIAYAQGHPELTFQVTCIGCGLAGLEHKNIAPMFNGAPDNCLFDELWRPYLGDHRKYWGSF